MTLWTPSFREGKPATQKYGLRLRCLRNRSHLPLLLHAHILGDPALVLPAIERLGVQPCVPLTTVHLVALGGARKGAHGAVDDDIAAQVPHNVERASSSMF